MILPAIFCDAVQWCYSLQIRWSKAAAAAAQCSVWLECSVGCCVYIGAASLAQKQAVVVYCKENVRQSQQPYLWQRYPRRGDPQKIEKLDPVRH